MARALQDLSPPPRSRAGKILLRRPGHRQGKAPAAFGGQWRKLPTTQRLGSPAAFCIKEVLRGLFLNVRQMADVQQSLIYPHNKVDLCKVDLLLGSCFLRKDPELASQLVLGAAPSGWPRIPREAPALTLAPSVGHIGIGAEQQWDVQLSLGPCDGKDNLEQMRVKSWWALGLAGGSS